MSRNSSEQFWTEQNQSVKKYYPNYVCISSNANPANIQMFVKLSAVGLLGQNDTYHTIEK